MQESSTDELLDAAIRHQSAGDLAAAQSIYRQILQRDPNDADAMQLLGVVLAQTGRGEEGLQFARRAVELNPQAADAHASLGEVYQSLGQHPQAAEELQLAVKLNPDFAQAWCNLGRAQYALDRWDESAAAFRRALQIQPQYPDALFSLGNTLRAQGHLKDAIDHYQKCIAIAPHNAHVHYNMATALESDRRPLEALEAYRRAIDGNFQIAHAKYGMLLLALGRWSEGWPELEWVNWHEKEITGKDRFPQPLWDGSPAPGKTLLLYESWGGMGDTLQFARFVPQISNMGMQVILQCQEPLVNLLAHSLAPARVVDQDKTPPAFDLCLPLESLPHRLGVTLENLTPSVPYLTVPPDRIAKWAHRVPADNLLNVGLVWAGSESSRRTNSIDLFAPLAPIPGIRFVSLQKGPAAKQKTPPGMNLLDLTQDLGDFADTAALIQQLDLVIGVDTSVPHLAAALAKPTWILIPDASDCRWMLDRDDSPWYPTVRLFRQEKLNDWISPISKLAQALADELKRQST